MLEDFKSAKENILGEIKNVGDILSRLNHVRPLKILEEVEKKLQENRFHLVVLGQFKRGKSTFINSIIGEDLLPTSVVLICSQIFWRGICLRFFFPRRYYLQVFLNVLH